MTNRAAAAMPAHSRRLAVFFGMALRRAETRFCARRKGDSSSTSRSTRRASSSVSRGESSCDRLARERSERKESDREFSEREFSEREFSERKYSEREDSALGGYNSSCRMVGLPFLAISSGQLSWKSLEQSQYSPTCGTKVDKKFVVLHR